MGDGLGNSLALRNLGAKRDMALKRARVEGLAVDPFPDTFRILVATDNHLGFEEKDPVRGGDSFRTFEEILQIAVRSNVDFLLLGGDLFHENKPSRSTMLRTVALLDRYCMGDRPVGFEMLSDPKTCFADTGRANYLDPNRNVALPVFCVHGNHDDPSGVSFKSAIDVLSATGLVNYFGKARDPNALELAPLLLRKGSASLALYGLGHIRDDRLHRTFRDGRVKWLLPEREGRDYVSVLVLHQNRVRHGVHSKNFVEEAMLPDFLDLVIWAHEHECRIEPTAAAGDRFEISQPGSSVATSLSVGEAVPKCVGLLEVRKEQYRMTSIPLETVRPFIFRDVKLSQSDCAPHDERGVTQFLERFVGEVLDEYKRSLSDSARTAFEGKRDSRLLPLVRVRADWTGFVKPKLLRFGQAFAAYVANPEEIVLLYRRAPPRPNQHGADSARRDALADCEAEDGLIESHEYQDDTSMIKRLLAENLRAENPMSVLLPWEAVDAVTKFVEKGESGALEK